MYCLYLLLRCGPEFSVHTGGFLASILRHSSNGVNFAAIRVGQQSLQGSHLTPSAFPHKPISQVLSCKGPKRSQLTFALGDVVLAADATDIRSITERHSLPLSSHTRITVDRPCGFTSPLREERYGLTLFR